MYKNITYSNRFKTLLVALLLTSAQASANFEKVLDHGQAVSVHLNSSNQFVLACNFNATPYAVLLNSEGDTLNRQFLALTLVNDIIATTDGGYMACGTESINGNTEAKIVKTDANFNAQWTKNFPTTAWSTTGVSVVENASGSFTVAFVEDGYTMSNPYTLTEVDATGHTVWSTVNNGSSNYSQQYQTMIQTHDHGYLSASSDMINPGSFLVVKSDETGLIRWYRSYFVDNTFNFTSIYTINSALELNSGEYILAGSYQDLTINSKQMFMMKLDSNGDSLWTKYYTNTNGEMNAVKENANQELIVAGTDDVSASSKISIIKTSSTGNTMWTQSYTGMGKAAAKDVMLDADNDIVAVGSTGASNAADKVYVVKTSQNFSNPTGVIDMRARVDVKAYPNPAKDILHFDISGDDKATVQLYSLSGSMVLEASLTNFSNSVDVASFAPGVYLFKVLTSDAKIAEGKIVKQ